MNLEEEAKKMSQDEQNKRYDDLAGIHKVVDEAIRGAKQEGYNISSNESAKAIKDLQDNHKEINKKVDILITTLDDYIKLDTEWKIEYQPYIKGLANVSGGAKIVVWIAIGISGIIGAIVGIRELFK